MVMGTMAGRCFTNQMLLDAPGEHGTQVWVPVTERAERLGVLSMTADSLDEEGRVFDEELGLLAALLVMAASPYTDRHHLQRRRQELDLAAEMQWSQNASTLSLGSSTRWATACRAASSAASRSGRTGTFGATRSLSTSGPACCAGLRPVTRSR